MPDEPSVAERLIIRPIDRFTRLEASSAIVLLAAVVAALVWANIDLGSYDSVWDTHLDLTFAGLHLDLSLRDWVNDLLMALFFFLIALEVKREMISGDLSDPKLAITPIAAAIGGMVAPALIYLAINSGSGGQPEGWAIPIATDVAFALGLLAALGRMAPGPLRAFLLTVAIVDDIGTIAIIALFFSEGLALGWLAAAAGLALVVKLLHYVPVHSVLPYIGLGAVLWTAVHESGVHATIAGVILGLLTPAKPLEPFRDEDLDGEPDSPLTEMESALHPWSAYLVLPIFALANAGVAVSTEVVGDVFTSAVGLGIVCGLVLGKPIGLVAATALTVRTSGAKLPEGVDTFAIACVGFIAGIGFTVALFISGLALPDPALLEEAKTAILVASVIAALVAVAAFALRSGSSRSTTP